MKKFCGLALTLALLMLLFPGTAFADSAGETTYTFRETFDNTAFPKAAKFRYTMPEGVVVNVPADKIFVMTGDKPLRAACGDGRALCMIKEYVNIDVEIIYYFEHGIRSIEYMGVCGAGGWAGAYNKEGTFSISTSDRLDGEYIYYDKNMYCNIEDESSVQAQYAIPEEDIPADARYVKLSFPNASKTPQGEYPFWSMGLAFLTVEAYNTDRPVPSSTTRRPTTTTQMQTMKPLTNITTVPVTTYRPATQAPAENENTGPLLGGGTQRFGQLCHRNGKPGRGDHAKCQRNTDAVTNGTYPPSGCSTFHQQNRLAHRDRGHGHGSDRHCGGSVYLVRTEKAFSIAGRPMKSAGNGDSISGVL